MSAPPNDHKPCCEVVKQYWRSNSDYRFARLETLGYFLRLAMAKQWALALQGAHFGLLLEMIAAVLEHWEIQIRAIRCICVSE